MRTRLAVAALIFLPITEASPLLPGHWDCATRFSRPEGDYRLQASTQLLNDGSFTSQGTVFAFNSLIGSEIPLGFTASGQWRTQGKTILGEVQEGNISTGFSFLDRIADLLEDEVRKQPNYTTTITQLNKQSLVLAGADDHNVECTKSKST